MTEIKYDGGTYTLDDLIEKAIEVAFKHGHITYSLIQKEVHVGYARAQRIYYDLVSIGAIEEIPWDRNIHPKILFKSLAGGLKLIDTSGPRLKERNRMSGCVFCGQ